MKAYSPTGSEIVATQEVIQGTCEIAAISRLPDGTLDIDYCGETRVDWDSQETKTDSSNKRLFVDENGEVWNEDQLVFEKGEVVEGGERIFSVRMAVTMRAFCTVEEVIAHSREAAIEKAKFIDFEDYTYELDENPGIEGDQLIYLTDPDTDEDIEVDRRDPGEPFSWTACEIVKDLAKLDSIQNFDRLKGEECERLVKLIERAVEACKVPA